MQNNIFKNIQNKILNILNKKSYSGFLDRFLVNSESWNENSFLDAYEISLYTNKAINKRAEKVGQIKFKHLKNGKEQEDSELINLLQKPNKFYTGRKFWELYQKYLDIFGEVYIRLDGERKVFEKNTKITSLWLLRPDLVEFKINKETGVVEYKYKKQDGNDDTYGEERIIRDFYPNPRSPVKGISLLKAGVKAISTEVQLAEYQANILKNGGRVESILKFKTQKLSRQQLREIKDTYKKEYASAKNSGRPLFLGGDADYITVGLKPEELAYLQSKGVTLDDICMMTGVPKSILGNYTDIKYSNAQEGYRIFMSETIKPLLVGLVEALNEKFELVPKDEKLEFIDPTPVDHEMRIKEIETANKINCLTINEKRDFLKYDSIKNGDEILIPFNLIPYSQEKSKKDGNQDKKKINKDISHPLRDEYIRRKYWKLQIKRSDRREEHFLKAVKKYFNGQKDRIIEKLEPTNMKIFRKKGLADEVFNEKMEIKIGIDKLKPFLETYLIEAGMETIEFIGSEYEFNISGEIISWLDKKTEIFLRSVNKTTFKELKKQFEESLANNEDRRKLIRRIKKTYGNINKTRAGTIARTEVQGITQKGTFEGYKQAMMPIKIWVAVMDSSTRDSHAYLDGEERPIDMPFSNGLMYPGADGPASEVINCRCKI